jgi:hypothetical protein
MAIIQEMISMYEGGKKLLITFDTWKSFSNLRRVRKPAEGLLKTIRTFVCLSVSIKEFTTDKANLIALDSGEVCQKKL